MRSNANFYVHNFSFIYFNIVYFINKSLTENLIIISV